MIKTKAGPTGFLVDRQGRAITYLRVSLTQRCNMKCGYCFGSVDHARGTSELSADEILRLIRSFAFLGISKIRFTGGEPLLRSDLVELVAEVRKIGGIKIIGLTTNGLLLKKNLPALVAAGLNRINISLDSLKAETFLRIAKVDGFQKVMAGINAALASEAFPFVQINTVVMRGINDMDLPPMARWALGQKIDIRFIEFMPTGKSNWNRLFISEADMRNAIGLELVRYERSIISPGPAERYRYRNMPGRVSFISAVSRSFCGQCNRLRLTSHGEIFGCLFQDRRIDLRNLLRNGADTEEIAETISRAIATPGFRREPDEFSIANYKPLMQAVGG